jgi:hypothetical protein
MEKTVETHLAQTAEDLPLTVRGEELIVDITITLERAELSAEGANFTVFVIWQDQTDSYDEERLGDFLRSRSWAILGLNTEQTGLPIFVIVQS